MVKNVYLTTVAFSAENDTLTPTQKIKRHQARELHKAAIEATYAEPIQAGS